MNERPSNKCHRRSRLHWKFIRDSTPYKLTIPCLSFHTNNLWSKLATTLINMASQVINSRLLLLTIPILACVFLCSCYARATDKNGARIRGMFVFGSSLVDNGNNNFLKNSMAKADFLPYGIDFPYGPSGRFTNGKNVIDLLCDQLKLPLVPAFTDPSTKGTKIIHGVNYASGASGILDDTGLLAVRWPHFSSYAIISSFLYM